MKTTEQAYKQARKGINIKKNEEIILKSKNPQYCYSFARHIFGANIKAHEKVILESKNIACCCIFALDIKESNKEDLFKVVLESGDKDWINIFIKTIDFDKEKYINYLLFI